MAAFGVLSASRQMWQQMQPKRHDAAPEQSRGNQTTRILIANDDLIFREGLRTLIEADASLQVIGDSSDGETALRLAREIRPDVLLLDWTLACQDEMHLLQELATSAHPVRTLLLSVPLDNAAVLKTLKCGAWGVVLKNSSAQMLLNAIRCVLAGQYWIGYECASSLIEALHDVDSWKDKQAAHPTFGLTHRECEIIQKVVEGYSNVEIARHFSLSQSTVKHHMTNVFDKLGVSTRLELAFFAVNHRLIDHAP